MKELKNRRAVLFFMAAALCAVSAVFRFSNGNSIDGCLWLSITAAELFLGLRELRGKTK